MKNVSRKIAMWLAAGLMAAPSFGLADGNEGAGGGNASDRDLVDKSEIAEVVLLSRLVLTWVLESYKHTVFQGDNNQIERGLQKKLYYSKRNPWAVLNDMKINIQNAPCNHKKILADGTVKEEESDGSAGPGDQICISLDRLADKGYTRGDVGPNVVGLVGHEFSHLMGALDGDESDRTSEAELFQGSVEYYVQGKINTELIDRVRALKEDFDDVRGYWDMFVASSDKGQTLASACAAGAILVQYFAQTDDHTEKVQGEFQALAGNRLSFVDSLVRGGLAVYYGCGIRVTSSKAREMFRLFEWAFRDKDDLTMYEILYRNEKRLAKEDGRTLTEKEFRKSICEDVEADCQRYKSLEYKKVPYGDMGALRADMYAASQSFLVASKEIDRLYRVALMVEKELQQYEAKRIAGQ